MKQKEAIPRLVDAVVMPAVLDVCCGSRAFWFDKRDERALFVDKRSGIFPRVHSDTPRAPVVVAPDWQGSFRELLALTPEKPLYGHKSGKLSKPLNTRKAPRRD